MDPQLTTATQRIIKIRRDYNTWVANETMEDYALRFAPRTFRKWSEFQVANTAFGAASFFDVREAALAHDLEKIEVRALGCLLEELATHCDATPQEATPHQALAELAQQCLHNTPAQRPSLAQVCAALGALTA